MGWPLLCLGVSPAPHEDYAAYLASWLKALQNDKRAVFTAASKASQAVEYLNDLQPEEFWVAA